MRRRVPIALTAAALLAAGTASVIATATPASASPAAHRLSTASPSAFMRTHGKAPRSAGRASALKATATTNGRLDPAAARQPSTRGGVVRVAVRGAADVVAEAAHRLGGKVLASANGTSSVLVGKAKLSTLAATSGIAAVDAAERPYPLATTSEGVAASGANVWHTALQQGTGVQLAIVDLGFGSSQAQYNSAASAGLLGNNPQLVNETCTDSGNVSTPYVEEHGLAVAELAHQEAPAAQLVLYCIGDNTGFVNAENAIETAHIKIASSSLGWFGDSRGDGTGPTGSAASVVYKARKAGILWIQSAGNEASSHWGRTMGDADHDHQLDINGTFNEANHVFEDDFIYARPAENGIPSSVGVYVQWDQWPTTTTPVTLGLFGYQCNADFGSGGIDNCDASPINPDGSGNPTPIAAGHVSGKKPVVAIDTSDFPNFDTQFDQVWEVVVVSSGTLPTTRWDFNYVGDTDGPSDNDCPTVSNNRCVLPVNAYSHSISAPADSPFAFAVGAANVGADGTPAGTLEYFSSQGPTIDGRVKPDITGWDAVSSDIYGVPSAVNPGPGFYGTSAAAPQVAGAAALVASLNPDLDAAQIQNFLEQRANSGAPINPPNNTFGHGRLTLGSPAGGAPAPVGARFESITPNRILDTRTTTGGHHARLGKTGTLQLTIPNLPPDATAVAINLTGTGATGTTYLSAYPGGAAFPNTSNVNLSTKDSTAAVFAIVTVHNGAITIRNADATVNVVVDELGYFGTAAEPGLMTSLTAAHRVLDTRSTPGHKLSSGKTVVVNPGPIPAGATAAIVNVTATGILAGGYVSAAPACSLAASTLNYGKYTRANLAIVKLSSIGRFCIEGGGGAADIIVDVQGFVGSSGSAYVALPSPKRVVDTRTNNGGLAGVHSPRPLASGSTSVLYGSNVGDVPASATALFTNVVEATATASGYLTLFPGSTKPSPLTSNLNFSAGRVVSNAVIAGLPASTDPLLRARVGIYNSLGTTNAVIDVFGYFQVPAG